MIRLTFTMISKIMIIMTKIIVLGVPAFILPLIILYASRLNAESLVNHNMSDPLEGQIVVRMPQEPEMLTIPVPAKSIRRGTVISQSDLVLEDVNNNAVNNMIAQDVMQLIGQEAKKTLYKNKPILLRDIGAITIIHRNDSVMMRFQHGAMTLQTTGRAMEEGGSGDMIKVMNEQSKKIVTGHITQNGEVDVSL